MEIGDNTAGDGSAAQQQEDTIGATEEIKNIQTKIQGLDTIFAGGIPKGSAILLIAPPMIEARLFCLEFIYRGLSSGEPGIYVTTDDSPENLKKRCIQSNWILAKHEENNIMKWVDTYSINANKDVKSTQSITRVGGPVALSDMAIAISNIEIAYYKKEFDYFRFVFDSLSTLLMYSNQDSIFYFLQSVVPKLKHAGGVGFFTLSSGMHDPKIEMTIRHLMDGAIVMDEDLNIKVLSFPNIIDKKDAKLNLTKQGFNVE